MNQRPIIKPYIDYARADLELATTHMRDYFARSTHDVTGQMDDVRGAIDALARAIRTTTEAVERLAVAIPADNV